MTTSKNIAVARLWFRKGKNEYFSFKQLVDTFPNIKFDFHIVLDEPEYEDEWTSKINDLNLNIKYYTKQFLDDYFLDCYPGLSYMIPKFNNFIHFYHILIGHYLRRVLIYDYMLTYEYDIVFNNDLHYLEDILEKKIPFGIIEPMNKNCDKALLNSLNSLYNINLLELIQKNNPNISGINAGFQGINLHLFDDILSVSTLESILNIFNFTGIYKEDGTEEWGWERTMIDTQEQSFYSLMNQIYSSNFKILLTDEYFFLPCWGDVPGYVKDAMRSKIVHFTGHKKAQELYDIINKKVWM